MEILTTIFIQPFFDMAADPILFLQVIWEGFVTGILYSLIALGFVLIFKASGVFNFAQGIMVVFAALTLVGLHENGIPAYIALPITILVMYALAFSVERLVLRPLVNQPDIILFMATIGVTFFLIGFGEFIFGGEPKMMITEELLLPYGSITFFDDMLILQEIDIAASGIAALALIFLALFLGKTKIGIALRAVADDNQAALSVGVSLNTIWVLVWFISGIIALITGIMWGAKSDVSFALSIIAFKALPVLILGGFTSISIGSVLGSGVVSGFFFARIRSLNAFCRLATFCFVCARIRLDVGDSKPIRRACLLNCWMGPPIDTSCRSSMARSIMASCCAFAQSGTLVPVAAVCGSGMSDFSSSIGVG